MTFELGITCESEVCGPSLSKDKVEVIGPRLVAVRWLKECRGKEIEGWELEVGRNVQVFAFSPLVGNKAIPSLIRWPDETQTLMTGQHSSLLGNLPLLITMTGRCSKIEWGFNAGLSSFSDPI